MVEQVQDRGGFSEAEQTDPAKSPYASGTLPFGLFGEDGKLYRDFEIRELTGVEEDLLAARRMKITDRLAKVIQNCVLRIGTIEQSDPKWSEYIGSLSAPDRMFLLRHIRVLSLGEELQYQVQCPECKKKSMYTFNLMSIEFKAPEKKQKSWSGKLPRSGKEFVMQALTGEGEKKVQQYINSDMFTAGIWARLLSFGGKSPVSFHEIKRLSTADRAYLRQSSKENEVSIDDEVEMECVKCGHEFSEDIDMNNPSFFFPTAM